MNNNARHKLLQSFCSTNENRPKLQSPFVQGENVFATDSYSIIILKATEKDRQTYSVDDPKCPKMDGFLSVQTEPLLSLDLESLKREYDRIKKKIDKIDNRCVECKGRGVVEFNYWSTESDCYTLEGECPVCSGTGVRNIETYISSRGYCMGITPIYSLNINRISDIIRTMGFYRKTKCDLLKAVGNGSEYPYHIIEPEFHLVLMPKRHER